MRMIPSTPHATNSSAERRVFDRLRGAFEQGQERGQALTVLHSLNLTRHASKRFGEADFVIVGPRGILVLEVKGGGIACHDGIWYSTDRTGVSNRLKESPFRQAEAAMHGLRSRLEAALPPGVCAQFVWGYAVVFPDCDWSITGAEWEQAMVADSRAAKNMERWLSGLYRYWHQRDSRRLEPATPEALSKIIKFLRPAFDVGVPLHVALDALEERVTALTDDQMNLLDIVDANPRAICTGGAGTGKTFLALELARRWAGSGQQVLLVCQSPWLKHWLEKRFEIAGVSVSVAKSVTTAARRAGVDQFDALIVDEGQDLLSMEALDRLDAVLIGGLEQGRWCFFHDINNQAGYFGAPDADALPMLESYGAARMPLKRNCRNTRQILSEVQSELGADLGVRGTGDGPEVVRHQAKTRQHAADVLMAEIERLTIREGLSLSEITILSPRPFPDSAAALLPAKLAADLTELDEFALRDFPPARISFAEIANFKGLENEAVILIDLPREADAPRSFTDFYVGMSRARSLLITIVTD
ncbi:AAA family ATPase [Thiorhodococcus mannitoliphagus]|uniref:AAA family ATPase n=1 Tax=Thiorhodococcus mannitoliphagus TaxID=329406 RepID=A0A6P1DM76_9GAMM|nr:nuclease-related domain-containing protein [Thiorhodococcus mannitoliphagus]NEX19019.1 AAA family ATPase [Thiorhodococcus mannitoliphagus]